MSRWLFCLAVVAVSSWSGGLQMSGSVAAADRPNVVIVITDDQGYGDCGFTGNEVVKTPNIDSLAAESSVLTDYHVAPTCSPTRSAFVTGHWTNRTGVWHTISGRSMLRDNEVTFGEIFSDAG
ncbi:sulfatase-like hydrolase/transferase, partial [Rhodopirellula bahusiensis]